MTIHGPPTNSLLRSSIMESNIGIIGLAGGAVH
jgi:hypothetical protein